MAEESIRFGVKDPLRARRTATWKIWAAKNTNDVYLVCRPVGRAIKLSLHQSGQWHFAFANIDLFDVDSIPETRFLNIYQKARPLIPGVTLACRVHLPWFSATIPLDAETERDTLWIAPAPEGHSIEVAIFLYSGTSPPPGDWPGRDSPKTEFVGQIELAGGGWLVVVQRAVPFVNLLPRQQPSQSRFFRGCSAADLSGPGLRAVGWAQNADGSIVVMEGPVLVGLSSGCLAGWAINPLSLPTP